MIVFYFQRSYVARMMKIMLGSVKILNSFLETVKTIFYKVPETQNYCRFPPENV